MNDFDDLQWFTQVVKHQSFAATAKKLNVSKSVVSKYISRLEQNLGAQLLNRSTRKLSLTEAGQRVYERAMVIGEEYEEIKHIAKTHSDVAEGRLKVNAPYGFGQSHMIPAIAAFMEKFPKISVELLLGSYLADLIHEGIDLAICRKIPSNPNTIIRKIVHYQDYLCASPQYFKTHAAPQSLDDLKLHNCLIYKTLDHARPWIFSDKKSKEIELVVSGNFSANSSRALLYAALGHMGIVKLASHVVDDYIKNGQLVSVLNQHCQLEKNIYIARAETAFLPKKTRAFIDFMITYFE